MTLASSSALVDPALRDAEHRVFWTDRPDAPPAAPPLASRVRTDLLVIGGGLTGLWTAIEALRRDPSRDVMLLEADVVGSGASGRNGGFISESLTHGIAHGNETWPSEMPELLRLGRENLAEIADFVAAEGIDAQLRLRGKSLIAVTPHQLAGLASAHRQHQAAGEDSELLDAEAARTDVDSPTYLGALRVRTGGGTLDPAALCWGLRCAALARGARLHEHSPVTGIAATASGVEVTTASGSVQAQRVVLGTNAFPPLLRRLRSWILPVYDHVLVTEPLTPSQRASIGWREEQGLTDAGNQFHYYRITPDGRILWGGYDAIYHFAGRGPASVEAREQSFRTLATHFLDTFPQLEGLRFTHRWFGAIDTTSRFTPLFGTAMGGHVAYSVGYTGLGVGASRFGARTALDLVDGVASERTALELVRRRPVPFPPEPVRYPLVRLTQAALAREDVSGRRGTYLRLLDRLGVGFNS
ncbi:NAD(P)/FAD-dependent oxidoreductase [Longivirga aurantiaca]|uniref:NAD(P)/FAD-dependent oxidoreductase n=1 Tax=Longivirga aurantiaca TaxID=1837743 RepID=A0ABW1SWS9_9ACTN